MFQLIMALLVSAVLFVTSSNGADANAATPDNPEAVTAAPGPAIGAPAPDFTGTDSNGKTHTLSGLRGKTVVLEWTNDQCPYVRKHYDTRNMQTLQQEATSKGIIWLTVNSASKGKQGYTTPDEANRVIDREKSHETARILDEGGKIGKTYGASTTPHMFVIDPNGILVYAGGIDDQSSVSQSTVKTANNYVRDALSDLESGHPVQVSTSKPYGCAVKY